MEVTPALIDQLAELARLEFTEKEKAALQHDLQRMISFVDQLKEVDTTGVEPLIHMSEGQSLRKDEVITTITREEALSLAKQKDDQFFKVPKVIEVKK